MAQLAMEPAGTVPKPAMQQATQGPFPMAAQH